MAADAYVELREAIMVGELAPGSPLRLEELARSLGMSISPVREAVRLLEAKGLAEYAPYRGARVTELSDTEMAEIYEARAALERTAIRRAARRFDTEHRNVLGATLRQLEKSYQRDEQLAVVRGNSAFHLGIASVSGSQWLQRLLTPLLEISERYAAAVLREGQPVKTREIEAKGHWAIVDALGTGDPDAAEAALTEHLRVFEDLYSDRHRTPGAR
jgi:DNA-binding GntR family transcriptional regulator